MMFGTTMATRDKEKMTRENSIQSNTTIQKSYMNTVNCVMFRKYIHKRFMNMLDQIFISHHFICLWWKCRWLTFATDFAYLMSVIPQNFNETQWFYEEPKIFYEEANSWRVTEEILLRRNVLRGLLIISIKREFMWAISRNFEQKVIIGESHWKNFDERANLLQGR